MEVFLTGGTGFIGQHITRLFLDRGLHVTALVRKPNSPRAQALGNMGSQLEVGDITKRDSMRSAMNGVDIVVHNAGHYEFGVNKSGKRRMYSINVTGTENVLSLAQEIQIPKILYVSSVVAFGDSSHQEQNETFKRQTPCCTFYEHTKTEAHKIACRYQNRGLPLVIVCPNAVIGANDHSSWGYFLRLYINRVMPPFCWAPNTIHGLVYVKDLAQGIALAVEKGQIGETYFLSGEFHTFKENVEFWSMKPGAFKPIFWLPPKLAAVLFTPLEPLQRWLGLPAFISRETAMAGATNFYYSSEKAKQDLGWTHRSGKDMWSATIDKEIKLRSHRKGQNLIQRLKPLETINL